MSFLDIVLGAMPSVKEPTTVPSIKKKLIWTGIVLALFFILGSVALIGLDPSRTAQLGMYQMIMASDLGTLISLGIGPIVLASIILQLLVGVKIINLDFSNPAHRARFSGLQKLLAIILSIVEAIVSTSVGLLVPYQGMFVPVVLQVIIGSILLIYLDEVVSKYGIGSGIGLFIAAGVCQSVLWRIFSLPSSATGYTGGLLFLAFEYIRTGEMIQLLSIVLLPIAVTLLVFFIVVYAEGMHVNIPLTVGRSGIGAKYPVKLLYVSNMPVILAATLFANIRLFAELAKNSTVISTIAGYLETPHGMLQTAILGGVTWTIVLQAIVYMIIFVAVCVVFGYFWVQVGGQNSDSVARQLQSSGMSIPGFRRDERVLVTVLNRYIPTITLLGSIFVGLLAFLADLTGALGTGTGILLTVGIVYRFYEQLAREQVFESGGLLKQLMGK